MKKDHNLPRGYCEKIASLHYSAHLTLDDISEVINEPKYIVREAISKYSVFLYRDKLIFDDIGEGDGVNLINKALAKRDESDDQIECLFKAYADPRLKLMGCQMGNKARCMDLKNYLSRRGKNGT